MIVNQYKNVCVYLSLNFIILVTSFFVAYLHIFFQTLYQNMRKTLLQRF